MTEPAPPAVACIMLSPGLGGLEQSLLDHCEALLLERHPVHALIHPRAAIRPALERLPLASLTDAAQCQRMGPARGPRPAPLAARRRRPPSS